MANGSNLFLGVAGQYGAARARERQAALSLRQQRFQEEQATAQRALALQRMAINFAQGLAQLQQQSEATKALQEYREKTLALQEERHREELALRDLNLQKRQVEIDVLSQQAEAAQGAQTARVGLFRAWAAAASPKDEGAAEGARAALMQAIDMASAAGPGVLQESLENIQAAFGILGAQRATASKEQKMGLAIQEQALDIMRKRAELLSFGQPEFVEGAPRLKLYDEGASTVARSVYGRTSIEIEDEYLKASRASADELSAIGRSYSQLMQQAGLQADSAVMDAIGAGALSGRSIGDMIGQIRQAGGTSNEFAQRAEQLIGAVNQYRANQAQLRGRRDAELTSAELVEDVARANFRKYYDVSAKAGYSEEMARKDTERDARLLSRVQQSLAEEPAYKQLVAIAELPAEDREIATDRVREILHNHGIDDTGEKSHLYRAMIQAIQRTQRRNALRGEIGITLFDQPAQTLPARGAASVLR